MHFFPPYNPKTLYFLYYKIYRNIVLIIKDY
jgi:hypothetical protein